MLNYVESFAILRFRKDDAVYRRMTLATRKKNRLLSKFLKVFITAFAVLIMIVGIGTIGYVLFAQKPSSNGTESTPEVGEENNSNPTQPNDTEDDIKNEKEITTFALFGVDKDGFRTDVVMLAFFNNKTKEINMISIPRDTRVKIPDDIYNEILTRRNDVEQIVKINEVPAYVEPSERNKISVQVIESAFGIDIDYYLSTDLKGLVAIVDLIGPIPMDIPFDMVYTDEAQKLFINLDKGMQHIWGVQAEQLIRYRAGYANADLGRINMQHNFMLAFAEKMLSVENKMNIVNLATAALLYIDTDFTTAIDYINYIDDIDLNNISIETLPGEASDTSRNFYIYDYDKTKAMLNTIFNKTNIDSNVDQPVDEIIEPEIIITAKELSISVQNGTNIAGFAGRTKEMLNGDGYNVIEAIDYDQKPVETTRLLVPSKEVGEELATYFNHPEININEDMLDDNIQAIIILGGSDE